MNEVHKSIINAIISLALILGTFGALLYLCFAFGNWDLNPGMWSICSRWWFTGLFIFGTFCTLIGTSSAYLD